MNKETIEEGWKAWKCEPSAGAGVGNGRRKCGGGESVMELKSKKSKREKEGKLK